MHTQTSSTARSHVTIYLLACGLSVCVLVGCGKKTKPTMKTSSDPMASAGEDVDARLASTSTAAVSLEGRLASLPGNDRQEYVAGMRGVLSDLQAVLPQLQGPDQDGTFRQRMRTIENASKTLAGLGSGLSPDPAVDSALRAAAYALADIAADPEMGSAKHAAALQALQSKLEALDRTHGDMHHLVAAEVVGQISQVVNALSAELAKRAAGEAASPPADAAAAPVPAPTAAPDAAEAAPAIPAPAEPVAPTPAEPTPAPADPAPSAAPQEPATPTAPAESPAAPAPAEPPPVDPGK